MTLVGYFNSDGLFVQEQKDFAPDGALILVWALTIRHQGFVPLVYKRQSWHEIT